MSRDHLPSGLWRGVGPELVQEKLVAQCLLVDHVHIVRRSLIAHAPPRVDELELAVVHKLTHQGLCSIALLVPPVQKVNTGNIIGGKIDGIGLRVTIA